MSGRKPQPLVGSLDPTEKVKIIRKTIRIPEPVAIALDLHADLLGTPFNKYVVHALIQHLREHPPKRRP